MLGNAFTVFDGLRVSLVYSVTAKQFLNGLWVDVVLFHSRVTLGLLLSGFWVSCSRTPRPWELWGRRSEACVYRRTALYSDTLWTHWSTTAHLCSVRAQATSSIIHSHSLPPQGSPGSACPAKDMQWNIERKLVWTVWNNRVKKWKIQRAEWVKIDKYIYIYLAVVD